MTTAKHSPGPWSQKKDKPGVIFSKANGYIGKMECTQISGDCTQRDANVRLVTAAPDLLEACVLAAEHHQGFHSIVGQALRAAIARATADQTTPPGLLAGTRKAVK